MPAPKGNKYALGCETSGHPPIYKAPEKLKGKVIEYFIYCQTNSEKPTITGLALFLGFCERKSLDDYKNRSKEYLYIIKRAKLAVEHSYELSGQTIDIFALKNMGWQDTHDITSGGNPIVPVIKFTNGNNG